MIISIITVLLVLGGLIFFHELGHYLMARALGMGVTTFSLGFGPKLLSKTVGKTEYCLSAIPLGGYCALVAEDSSSEVPEGFTRDEYFSDRPAWQRLLVVLAGPVANILLAWVLCIGLAYGYGEAHLVPSIGEVQKDSPAASVGLKSGDIVLKVNDTPIDDWTVMAKAINASAGNPMTISVERAGKIETFKLSAKSTTHKNIFGEDKKAWVIGVKASGETAHVDIGFVDSIFAGAKRTWTMVELTWTGFVKLFQRVVPMDQVGGPIMIAQVVGKQASEGLANVLAIAALISINLGILNLLPIPVLDGGHIVFFILEMIFRRPLPIKVREISSQVGFFLLIGLMVFATYNDIVRIFKDMGS